MRIFLVVTVVASVIVGSKGDHATHTVKSCGVPDAHVNVPHSEIIDFENKVWTYGETFQMECNKWYTNTSGASKWRCDDDETWHPVDSDDGSLLVCSPICGKTNAALRRDVKFISNGDPVAQNEFPWLVFINLGNSASVGAVWGLCTGSLISPNLVLTTAHCMHGRNADHYTGIGNVQEISQIHVWLGVHNRLDDFYGDPRSTAFDVGVKRIIVPEDFNKGFFMNHDVALIELKEEQIMTDHVRTICLPESDGEFNETELNGRSGTVAGWGLYDGNSMEGTYHLKKASLPVKANRDECRSTINSNTYGELDPRIQITENMFCAGFPNGGISTCSGLSGVPYMMSSPSRVGTKIISGVASWGVGRCGHSSSSYTVFSQLNRPTVDWIKDQMLP